MKIIRNLILLLPVSLCYAVTVSIDNQTSCKLSKIGTGQLPSVNGHQSPTHIPAHTYATIEADVSQYQHSNNHDTPFFDLYLIRCNGHESSILINGEESLWHAELAGGAPVMLGGGISEDGSVVHSAKPYNVSLDLMDIR